jgi:arginyl-tRNA synthetase
MHCVIFAVFMQGIAKILQNYCIAALQEVFQYEATPKDVVINETKPEFKGHYTIVTFGLSKALRLAPQAVAGKLGEALVQHKNVFTEFEVIQGFLNITFSNKVLAAEFNAIANNTLSAQSNGEKIMVEFASPNTNKPLHLGHLRNIFLGDSICKILNDEGYEVIKANLINDRGIHICKSMYAWQQKGNGATPASTGIKGDHFVGDYYVAFENILKEQVVEISEAIVSGQANNLPETSLAEIKKLQTVLAAISKEDIEKQKEIQSKINELIKPHTACMLGAQQMLIQWEQKDEAIVNLWRTMNGWVYEGFDATYKSLEITFDKYYYESNTYLLGKDILDTGLSKNIFYKKEDGSVWINLTEEGYDEKLLLRSNGTSVYMTQDLGTAQLKYADYGMQKSVYVIADEQNYHMQVLKLIMQKMQQPGADGIYHLSYGMVELPEGRMKSREGTVVDADDLVAEMIATSKKHTDELGKTEGFSDEELNQLYTTIGIAALKFYLLRVEPKKKMIFNPKDSIDFHGFTGPFVQYTYARISSILRRQSPASITADFSIGLLPLEEKLVIMLTQFSTARALAVSEYNPSNIALYVYNLAKAFNSFLAEHKILQAESVEKMELRLQLCAATRKVIKHCMDLLGAHVPEKM